MSFANREQLATNLRVETLSPAGATQPITYLPEPPPQVQAVLGSNGPMLAGYSAGRVRVTLTPFAPAAPEGTKPRAD